MNPRGAQCQDELTDCHLQRNSDTHSDARREIFTAIKIQDFIVCNTSGTLTPVGNANTLPNTFLIR